ncbi:MULTISPECIES: hypothetical protein [unclassified Spirosoma]|uniref:hypothetical protein n=1 Tax=unclassified Spirosoma TaxID=2621999 RepID=UPI000A9A5311|nr:MULTISPECIES: hypothetical protein [unclassified Spirosoma]MBN8825590.1 hypothetical protein [Spirosoma sp.]
MKIGLLSILCFVFRHGYAIEKPKTLAQTDSLPSQHTAVLSQEKYRYRLGGFGNQVSNQRLFVLVVLPKNLRLGNEVTLSVGVDERTITVRSGEKTLKLWDDYVLIPGTNKMRILDEETLNADRPIRITYEKLY